MHPSLPAVETVGPQWGQSFSYDGWGNLLSKGVTKGAVPVMNLTVDGNTNRISTAGFGYDAAGNMTTMPFGGGSQTITYDHDNRVASVTNSGGTESYTYDTSNRRVVRNNGSQTEVTFYGIRGEKLGRYLVKTYSDGSKGFDLIEQYFYFGGRMTTKRPGSQFLTTGITRLTTDRLSSVGDGSTYYPYGEEKTVTANDKDKFATYYRDSVSGLDYALNRYYSSVYGRFLSSDPYRASGGPRDPGSWNRYAYVQGDPVNFNDPTGLYLSRSSDERRENSNIGAKDLGGWYSGAYGGSSSPAGSSSGRDGAGGRSRRTDFAGWESALAALDTQECATALGFENSETAKMRLHGTGIVRREGPTAAFEQNVLSGWWQLNTILPAWVDNDTIYLNTNLFLAPDQIKNPEGKSLLNYAQVTLGLSDVPTVATFQAIYLLHELGHISGHLPNDKNDVKTSETNSRTVVENCFPGLRLQ